MTERVRGARPWVAQGELKRSVGKERLGCTRWETCRMKHIRYVKAGNAIVVSSWFH